jgi:elongation factor 1-delta
VIFLRKLLKKEDRKEKFYHPSLQHPFGPVESPVKRPRNKTCMINETTKTPEIQGAATTSGSSSLSEQIARARDHIKNSLDCVDGIVTNISSSEDMALVKKLDALEIENKQLKKVTDDLKALVLSLEARVGQLEGGKPVAAAAKPVAKAAAPAEEEDDDDVDLFGSDDEEEESEEKKRITEERLKAYNEKKAKKPKIIAKTSVLLDVKPWDDETDHDKMLESVKSIEMEGLVWGASKLVPIGYGIKKLQVIAVVEDELVSVDELSEKIEEFEDYVQSVDVAAMNKI